MSKNTSFGLIQFYKTNQERDWQLLGYYNNWRLAINYVPRDVLVSFRTQTYSGTTAPPETMKIRKVTVIDGEVEVLSETNVTSSLMRYTETIDGDTYTYYYRQQGSFTDDELEYLTSGCIYDIYIEDSLGNTFVSDLFVAITITDVYLYAENNEPYLTEDGQQLIFE